MKGYAIHLLFHLLALAVGGACGVAAGIWWFGHNGTVLWLALAGAVAALLILALQGFYIAGSQPPPSTTPRPSAALSSAPRPAPNRHGDTAIQPGPLAARAHIDQDTHRRASEALHEHGQS